MCHIIRRRFLALTKYINFTRIIVYLLDKSGCAAAFCASGVYKTHYRIKLQFMKADKCHDVRNQFGLTGE